MNDSNGKKRKFLKPIEFAVAALLSVAMPATAATAPNDSQLNNPTVKTAPHAKHAKQKQLLVKPSDNYGKKQLADYDDRNHYSHSSHSSHSSHYSSSR